MVGFAILILVCIFYGMVSAILGSDRLSNYLQYEQRLSFNTSVSLTFLLFPLAPITFLVFLIKDLRDDIKRRREFENDNRY